MIRLSRGIRKWPKKVKMLESSRRYKLGEHDPTMLNPVCTKCRCQNRKDQISSKLEGFAAILIATNMAGIERSKVQLFHSGHLSWTFEAICLARGIAEAKNWQQFWR
jgi:hypothetical protein